MTLTAQGITLTNVVADLGSLFGPYLIGVIRQQNESVMRPATIVRKYSLSGLAFLFLLRGRHEAVAQSCIDWPISCVVCIVCRRSVVGGQ